MRDISSILLDIFCFSSLLFTIWQQNRTIKDLTNKIMARNYGELVQAEVLKKEVQAKSGLDVKVKEPDNEPDSVELLNKYF